MVCIYGDGTLLFNASRDFLLKKISVKKRVIFAVLLLFLGLLYRVSSYQPIFSYDNYFRHVYYPLYGAADLYFSGMIFGYSMEARKRKRAHQFYSTAFIVSCCLFGFLSVYLQARGQPWLYTTLYSYLGPTLLSIATTAFLILHEDTKRYSILPQEFKRGIDWLGKYSFEFYMIHSYVLVQIAPYIQTGHPITRHLLILIYVFAISVVLSVMFHLYTEHLTKCIDTIMSKIFVPTCSLYCWKKLFAFYSVAVVLLFIVFLIFT